MKRSTRAIPFVLICLLLPWFGLAGYIFFPKGSPYSDLLISHAPNAIHILQSISTQHSIPLWSPLILGGYPFAENPLAGIWYPPGWLAYLFPLQFGFNITVLIHLLWGGFGIYKLLNYKKLNPFASLLGAIAFICMPKLFSHWAAGHVTLVYAVCWTPWLFFVWEFYFRSHPFRKRGWLYAGIVLGVIALADPRWLVYCVITWLIFIFTEWLEVKGWTQPLKENAQILLRIILSGLVCFAVGAVLLLGLIQYSGLSTRADLQASDVLAFSLPVDELPGLIVPDFGGYAEWTLYPGAAILFLAVYCCAVKEVRRKIWVWVILLFLSILFSLGNQISIWNGIASIPIVNLLRVPPRAMFIGEMSLIILAAYGLDDLLSRETRIKFDPVFFMTPILAFLVFLASGMLFIGAAVPVNLIWGILFFGTTLILIALEERKRLPGQLGAVLILLFVGIDLFGVNFQSIDFVKSDTIYNKNSALINYLKNDPSQFRIYTPSNSLTQFEAAQASIEMINGIDPLQYRDFVDYFQQASGIKIEEYSVTLPPLEGNQVSFEDQTAVMDAKKLGLLNVKYVITDFSMNLPDLPLVTTCGENYIYKNLDFLPRAWIQEPEAQLGINSRVVENISMAADRITIQASGPGLLVISEVDYPGWKAKIDGKPAEILRVANLLQGVQIEGGAHIVEFYYFPIIIYVGMGISTAAWGMIMLFIVWNRKKHVNTKTR